MVSRTKSKRIVNVSSNNVLATRARLADSFVTRLAGLLFSPPLQPGEGLVLQPCNSIHMFGMKFALDAVFVDKQSRVVGVVESIAPGQISKYFPNANACFELPPGTIADTNTKVGDQVEVLDADQA
jgi:uncharacterized membrane protein (UPF0127 family)